MTEKEQIENMKKSIDSLVNEIGKLLKENNRIRNILNKVYAERDVAREIVEEQQKTIEEMNDRIYEHGIA